MSNDMENDLQRFVHNGVDPDWRGNANFYISFHTADPGEAGTQLTSEISYTGYARVAIVRNNTTEMTVTGNSVTTAVTKNFGERTDAGSPITATHVGIGRDSSGAGKLLYSWLLNSPIVINQNSIPQLPAGGYVMTKD
jgi:hypothetical protein